MPPASRKYCLIKALKNHHCDHSMIPFPGAWHRAGTLKIYMHRVKLIGQSASDCLKPQPKTRMWFIVPTQLFLASKLPFNRCKASSSLSVSGTWKWPSSVHWRCWLASQCCRWLLGIAWISGKPKKTHEKTGEVKPMLEVKRKLYVIRQKES